MGITARVPQGDFNQFTSGNIDLKYAAIASSFTLVSSFDHKDPVQRQLFRPMSYQDVEIIDQYGSTLITGTVTNTSFNTNSNGTTVTIVGYSKTGILMDCTSSVVEPSQYDNLSLQELAEKICEPFGIKVVVDQAAASKASEPSDTAGVDLFDYTEPEIETIDKLLRRRASELGLIISHNNKGNLVITQRTTEGSTIATYRDDVPLIGITVSSRGNDIHHKISVIGEPDLLYFTEEAAQEDIINPIANELRTITKTQRTQSSQQKTKPESIGKSHRGEQMRNITASISSDRWYWWNGDAIFETIRPNKLIDIISPSTYLAERTKFLVESVSLSFDSRSNTANLKCVLPEVYNNEEPKYIFS